MSKTIKINCDYCGGYDMPYPNGSFQIDSYTHFCLAVQSLTSPLPVDHIEICDKCWPKFIKAAKELKL